MSHERGIDSWFLNVTFSYSPFSCGPNSPKDRSLIRPQEKRRKEGRREQVPNIKEKEVKRKRHFIYVVFIWVMLLFLEDASLICISIIRNPSSQGIQIK